MSLSACSMVQLLYITFLAEFFLDDADDERMYYSEMKDAGYFEEYGDDY